MIVYKLTNRMTGMAYVGATIRSLERRVGDHRAQAKKGLLHPLAVAIRDCGWKAFDIEIVSHHSSIETMHAAERATIAALNTIVPHGYNRASGGLGTPDCRHTESTKRKLAAVHLGKPGHRAWNKGATVSSEVRAKISAGLKGRASWNKGLPATDEHRAALVASHVGKINPASRPVEVNGQQFPTIRAAAIGLNLTLMQVRYKLMTGRARYLDS